MNRGFSLVELSIVLVILGLLTGGILAGQSLIRASELRAVSTEYQRYAAAVNTFRDKYFSIPGDMTNAISFWGASATCPGVAATAATGVCNGDGNGLLTIPATSHESFGFWEHLAYAGLIEGTYTGNSGDATATNPTSLIGTNVPRSKINNAGWSALSLNVGISDTNWPPIQSNMFFFGASPGANFTYGPILKPEEAWNIDTKMDDGKPQSGNIMSPEYQGSSSATTACSDADASNSASLSTSNYALSRTGNNCALIFTLK